MNDNHDSKGLFASADFGGSTGGGGKGEGKSRDPHAALRGRAKAKFAGFLAQNQELKPALREQYQAAADQVIDGMGPKALEAWHDEVVSTHFYSSIKELDAKAAELKGESKKEGTTFGLTVPEGDKSAHHLNGGSENRPNPEDIRKPADYYAHEFAHAVDIHRGFSQKQEWHEAWKADREYITLPIRGVAHEDPKKVSPILPSMPG